MPAGLIAVRRPGLGGWPGFGCWAIVGTALAFSFVAMASIGLFVLPAAFVVAWLTSRYVESGPELLGLIAGAAAVSLAVGLVNIDNFASSCPAEGSERLQESAASCGGLDPVPWLVTGALLALVSAGIFSWIRHRDRG